MRYFFGLIALTLALLSVTHSGAGEAGGLRPGFGHPRPGFGHPPKAKCRTCESAKELRTQTDFLVPDHGIIFDFSNGVFWRNSRLLVVDLDGAEAVTYRMPPEADHPTKLVVSGRRAIPNEELSELVRMAGMVWNPPISEKLEPPHTDTFQELDVVDGPIVGKWLEMGGGALWFVKLREHLSALVVW
jgi:hypothetical protein